LFFNAGVIYNDHVEIKVSFLYAEIEFQQEAQNEEPWD